MFTTKKYTRPLLRKELKRVNVKHFHGGLKTLAAKISPRAGTNSAKIAALRAHVGARNLNAILRNVSFAAKDALLEALK